MSDASTGPQTPEKQKPPFWHAARIKDARDRKVIPFDPVAAWLLRQHDGMDADVLQAIAHEAGVQIAGRERISLILGVLGVFLVMAFIVQSLIAGDFDDAPFARMSSLAFFSLLAWMYWLRAKHARVGHIGAAMLKYARCPGCGYDLRLLPIDPNDGATVCPECGCAWKLNREGE